MCDLQVPRLLWTSALRPCTRVSGLHEVRRVCFLAKRTKRLMYSKTHRGCDVKHLVSFMEAPGRCSGRYWQVWQVVMGSCVLHRN